MCEPLFPPFETVLEKTLTCSEGDLLITVNETPAIVSLQKCDNDCLYLVILIIFT